MAETAEATRELQLNWQATEYEGRVSTWSASYEGRQARVGLGCSQQTLPESVAVAAFVYPCALIMAEKRHSLKR